MAGSLCALGCGIAGCNQEVKLDSNHIAAVDALISDRTTSSIHSLELLKIDPRIEPEAPVGLLTLNDAVNRTLMHNLNLVASAENLLIAQAQLQQAGLFQNPTLGQTGALAFPLYSHGGATSFDILIAQTINTFFTQPHKVAVAEAQRFQTGIDLANQAFDLSQQAESKYQEMVHLLRNQKLAEKSSESYLQAVKAAEARAKVGIVPQPDVNRARLQFEDAERQVRHLKTQYLRATREMNWLMGSKTEPRWTLPPELLDKPKVLPSLPLDTRIEDLGKRFRLDLLRADFDRKVSEANVKLARLGLIPDITIGFDAARDSSKHWTVGPAGLSLPLPIFDSGTVALAMAKSAQRLADKTYVALEGQVQQDVRTAYDNLQIDDEDVRFYRDKLIPQEEENVQLAKKSFELGNTDLDSQLNTLREYLTVLQAYEDSIATYQSDLIALQRATGLEWDRIAEQTQAAPASTGPSATGPSATGPHTTGPAATHAAPISSPAVEENKK